MHIPVPYLIWRSFVPIIEVDRFALMRSNSSPLEVDAAFAGLSLDVSKLSATTQTMAAMVVYTHTHIRTRASRKKRTEITGSVQCRMHSTTLHCHAASAVVSPMLDDATIRSAAPTELIKCQRYLP